MSTAPQLDNSWWGRPAGGREVLALSLPLIISTSFWAVSWFFDRLFLTWYDNQAMAASMPAGMLHWTVVCLPSGVAAYVNTFVAQYYGAGQNRRIGLVVGQGMWLGVASLPFFAILFPLSPLIFAGASANPQQVQFQTEYFQSLLLGAPAMVIVNALSAFYTGRGKTGLVMAVNIAGNSLDLFLDYAMVFGEFGFPRWGIIGAGVSTAIGHWFNLLIFAALMLRKHEREEFELAGVFRWDLPLVLRLLWFGLPSGLPMLIESFGFALLTRFITGLGDVQGAATSLAFNVNAVAFVPVIGLGIGVSTLVGQYLGDNRDDLAARATWTGLTFALGFSVPFAAAYWFVPDWFIYFHERGASATEFAEVRNLTIILLRFVAIYCLFDATQLTFVSALKGAGDTRFVLFVAVLLTTLSILFGQLVERYLQWGVYGWWYVMTGWICAMAIAYGLRFVHGGWRTMRVIEPELVPKVEVSSSEF